MICIEYSKTHEDLRVLMRYLVLLHCLTEYQKRLEFPLRQGEYDDVFISNLIIFYNKLHFVDIVELRGSNPPSFHRSEATAFSWFFKGLRAFTAARRGAVPKSYAQKASPVFDLC